jgi:hypothetical protein
MFELAGNSIDKGFTSIVDAVLKSLRDDGIDALQRISRRGSSGPPGRGGHRNSHPY